MSKIGIIGAMELEVATLNRPDYKESRYGIP